MTPQRWRSLELLFHQVVGLPPAERDLVLSTVDAGVREEIECLLAADAQAAQALSAAIEEGRGMLLPQRFGPYRVTGLAGRGGMGAVYRAIRDDGTFEKEVAIKVMHTGLSAGPFRQERAILASLEHPNIARLLDGGETETGVSYIVMEYVDGLPLLEYCGRENLPTMGRLRLFLDICSAVQYAHQKLVIHRDLKPGNILVTGHEGGAGVPKLLDFGVAKLLDPDAHGTLTMQAMTPDYASPEQVRGRPVSTATDVYSLGLVMYEMLTGRRPYRITALTPSEVERVICESTPAPAGISDDLDNILLMALRKEAERRYGTVREFAEDIERSLTNRPVHARPDTLAYRSAKFVRRNRVYVLAAVMVAAALIGGITASQFQARRAERRFEDVRQLANTLLVNVNTRLPGTPTTAREEIVNTSLIYLRKLSAEAGGDGRLRSDLAAAYQIIGDIQSQSLGKTEEARRSYANAIELAEGLLAARKAPPVAPKALAAAYLGMLDIDVRHGESGRAMAWGQKALAMASDAKWQTDWGHDFLITAYIRIARPFLEVGRPSQALAADRKGLQLADRLASQSDTEDLRYRRAVLHMASARALKARGDMNAASLETEQARALFFTLPDPADPRYAPDVINALLGPPAGEAGGPPDLFPLLCTAAARKQALDLAVQAAARDPGNAGLRSRLAVALWGRGLDLLQGDRTAALGLLRQAVQTGNQLLEQDPSSASLRNLTLIEADFGVALTASGNSSEGLRHLLHAVEVAETDPSQSPVERWKLIEPLRMLGVTEAGLGDFGSSRAHLDRCLRLSLALWPDAREDLRSFAMIGKAYAALGDLEQLTGHAGAACDAYRKSLDTWQAWPTTGTSSFYDRNHSAAVSAKLGAACRGVAAAR
jgi:tetratricopeptide (TPR) repeat protein